MLSENLHSSEHLVELTSMSRRALRKLSRRRSLSRTPLLAQGHSRQESFLVRRETTRKTRRQADPLGRRDIGSMHQRLKLAVWKVARHIHSTWARQIRRTMDCAFEHREGSHGDSEAGCIQSLDFESPFGFVGSAFLAHGPWSVTRGIPAGHSECIGVRSCLERLLSWADSPSNPGCHNPG